MFRQRRLERRVDERLAAYLNHIQEMGGINQTVVKIPTMSVIDVDVQDRDRRRVVRERVLTSV